MADGSRHDHHLCPADIAVEAGFEPPFTGLYWDHRRDGQYRCIRCEAPLFESADKVESGSGWAAYDAAIPDAVAEHADGAVRCARCQAPVGRRIDGAAYEVSSWSLDFQPRHP